MSLRMAHTDQKLLIYHGTPEHEMWFTIPEGWQMYK